MSTDDLLQRDSSSGQSHVNDPGIHARSHRASLPRTHSASRDEGERGSGIRERRPRYSPRHSIVQASHTYGTPEIGFGRLEPEELAALRQPVVISFPAPSQDELATLCRTLERIQRGPVQEAQRRYLTRCWRIHGPDAERLLVDLFAMRRAVNNLLLALETTPPTWAHPGSDRWLEADGEA